MTISPWALALLLLFVAGVCTALGYALAVARSSLARADGRDELSRLRSDAASWQARTEELGTRAALAEERAERDGAVLRALAPVRAQLDQVGSRVEAMEKERSREHATLTEQLRAAARTDRELQRTTASLEGALRSRSARGMWGEVELARVLEASGMMRHVDFSEQRSVASVLRRRSQGAASTAAAGGPVRLGGPVRPGGPGGPGPSPGPGDAPDAVPSEVGRGDSGRSRPDVVVHLPGDGHLAVDAKVPLDSYLAACAVEGTGAEASARREDLLAAHARALRSHVKALEGRHYDRSLGDSPELVVLFVPAEPVLAAALEADPGLLEDALGLGVALTSPASLLALLRTCATAWARTAVNEDARELLELGRTLYERLGTLAGHLDSLGSALRRSVVAYNRVVGSVENRLLVTARSLENLGASLPGPSPVDADAAQVRSFSAPELTGDPSTGGSAASQTERRATE